MVAQLNMLNGKKNNTWNSVINATLPWKQPKVCLLKWKIFSLLIMKSSKEGYLKLDSKLEYQMWMGVADITVNWRSLVRCSKCGFVYSFMAWITRVLVFSILVVFLGDKSHISKHEICVRLKLFSNISIMLQQIHISKRSLTAELT